MASGHLKHLWSHSNGWDANTLVNGHIIVLGRLLHKSFRSFPCLLVCGRKWERIRFWEDLFFLLSSFGISSPFQSEVLCLVSGTQEAWGINRSSFPTLLSDDGVVAQIISVSQDGLGSLEEHL
ncbi:hypothetical protein CK203_083665 [Vitis vinifera]|uniref:Uncharacterized protein n=1 Tax=Vitis vinifera TaxID=29760 RepID=A0A438CYH8_VITVI|nr:hypothetical protein CK203_083665 [Vitis vinifera]